MATGYNDGIPYNDAIPYNGATDVTLAVADTGAVQFVAQDGATLTFGPLTLPVANTGAIAVAGQAGSRLGIKTRPVAPAGAPTYEVKIVERDGTLVRALAGANVKRIRWVLNEPEEIVFGFPKHDPASAPGQGADVDVLEREVQVWRNSDLLAWGVPLEASASGSSGEVEVTARGVAWYFSRRFIDRPRTNFLANPQFESDLTGWEESGTTATVSTAIRRLGTKAAQLVQATSGADAFLRQQVVLSGGEIGLAVTLAGYFYLDDYQGATLNSRGLYVEGISVGEVTIASFTAIDDATPRGQWMRAETSISIPAGQTWTLDVRLYSPNGTIVWDALQLVVMESLGLFDGDLAELAGLVVDYIQAPWSGKGTLEIGHNTPLSGITLPVKFWQFADHIPADSALRELVEHDQGIDWSIELTPTTKTFTTHWPRKGIDRSATTTLELGVNVATYDGFDLDGSAVETDVTITGDGDGPDREEGYARDISSIPVVLQAIYASAPGTEIDQLDPRARDRLAVGKRLVRLPQLVTHQRQGDLIHLLQAGDTVRVVLTDGWVQVASNYRIVAKELQARTDTLALVLNEV